MSISPLHGEVDAVAGGGSPARDGARTEGELRSVSIAVGVLDCFVDDDELGPTQVGRRLGHRRRAPRAGCSRRWPSAACSTARTPVATGSA